MTARHAALDTVTCLPAGSCVCWAWVMHTLPEREWQPGRLTAPAGCVASLLQAPTVHADEWKRHIAACRPSSTCHCTWYPLRFIDCSMEHIPCGAGDCVRRHLLKGPALGQPGEQGVPGLVCKARWAVRTVTALDFRAGTVVLRRQRGGCGTAAGEALSMVPAAIV